MNNKTILVTGGSGFIGTNLVEYLLNKNYNVISIDKYSYCSVHEKFKNYKNKKNYTSVKINLINEDKLIGILKKYKPNLIFNLAAESHVDKSIDSPKKFIQNNLNSSIILIETVRKLIKINIIKKIKIVHLSTDEVYGSNKFLKSKENDILKPNSPYSSSKASIDNIFRSYYKTFNLPVIIARCCNNFGPYQFPEKFIPTAILTSIANKKIPIYGSGLNVREWIYVKACCKALDIIMRKGKLGEIYNIGSGKLLNNKLLALKIYNIINNKNNLLKLSNPLKFVKDRPGHDFRYCLNSSKLNKLQWKSSYKFEKALLETIEWYIKNLKWVNNCEKKYKGERQGLSNK